MKFKSINPLLHLYRTVRLSQNSFFIVPATYTLLSCCMEYPQGQPRNQLALYTTCLDDMVPDDNTVRLIDQFVDSLDMRSLGFETMSSQGRPPYHPADLLKLYIYSYMNRMRSSRQLEKECHRNLEVIWLLKNLKPDHNRAATAPLPGSGKIIQKR